MKRLPDISFFVNFSHYFSVHKNHFYSMSMTLLNSCLPAKTSGKKRILVFAMIALFILSHAAATSAVEPTIPATFAVASGANCNEIDLSWVSGDGTKRLVLASANNPVSVLPVDGQSYSAATNFGSGSNLGGGNYVVYNSNGTNVTISGLNGGVHYYFAIFEFNGSGFGTNYLTSIYATADTFATGISLSVLISDSSFCVGASANLEAHGAPFYDWSPGTGLSSTTDSLIVASPTLTTQYTVQASDQNGCQISARFTLTVNSLPVVNLGNFADICVDGTPFTLSGGTPSGGTYSGPGVSAGVFNPAVSGSGIHTIAYSYTNAQGCSSADSSTIRVNSLPTVNLSTFLSTCVNSTPFNLTGGTPGGGFYSGTGVSSGTFNPATAGTGVHTITYSFTNVQGCTATDTSSITVNGLPVVSLASLPSVCIDVVPFPLTGGSPSGGTYSGAGVSSGTFNPSVAGSGNQLITYAYTDGNGCSASALSSIFVNDLPTVDVGPFTAVCVNATPLTLGSGSPSGGIYSGAGVSNDTLFSAAAADTGLHIITYIYTDGNGCVNRDSSEIRVNPLPVVTQASFPAVCANTGPVSLTGGNPAGGTYSGPAVGGSTFFTGIAGAGSHTITYTYTDVNTCTNSAASTIVVNPVPQPNLGADTTVCAETNVVLTAGTGFSTYTWSTGQNTASVTIDSTGHGLSSFPVILIVTNSFACANRDTIRVTFTPCAGIFEDQSVLNEIIVFPNPSASGFVLESLQPFEIDVLDLNGRLIENHQVPENRISFGHTYPPGIYLARLKSGGRERIIKIVKE